MHRRNAVMYNLSLKTKMFFICIFGTEATEVTEEGREAVGGNLTALNCI